MNPTRTLINAFFNERDRWFLWLPVFMVGGIAFYFSLAFEPSVYWLGLTPFLALLAVFLRKKSGFLPCFSVLLLFGIGFNAAQLESLRLQTPMLQAPLETASVTGTLIRAEAFPEGARLTLKNPQINAFEPEDNPRLVRVKTRLDYESLPPAGVRINVWGPLWPPSQPVIPDGFDFGRHAYFSQIGGAGMSYVEPRVRPALRGPPFFWDGFLIAFEKTRRALNLMVFERLDGPVGTLTSALLSGSRSSIDPETMEAMRKAGLTHLLVISGLHVSMMAVLVYVPLRFIFALFPWVALRLPVKKIAAFIAILSTSLYTILVGADAPTVRAALMTGLFFFAILSDRKALSLRIVALAAMAIMLVTPSTSMGPSFQLSFAAVIAIIAAFEKRIDQALRDGLPMALPAWLGKTGRHLRDIALTSVIATLATAPFTLFYFQTFSFYGVLANMLAIPLTSLWVLPCLLLTYISAPFGGAGLFIDGAAWGVNGVLFIAKTVAAWPLSAIAFPPMPVSVLIGMVGGGLWLCLWRGAWRFAGIVPLILCLSYPLFVSAPSVFVAQEKNLWAVVLSDKRMAVYGARKENFTVSQWAQKAVYPALVFLKAGHDVQFGDELSCTGGLCSYERARHKITFILPAPRRRAAPIIDSCPQADIIVTYRDDVSCKAPLVIDAQKRAQDGAYSITFKGNDRQIAFVNQTRKDRPWSPKLAP